MGGIYVLILIIFLSDATLSSDDNTKLLFTNGRDIAIYDVNTGNVTEISGGSVYALFVAYHSTKNLIFWTDYHGGTISRIRYPSDRNESREQIGVGNRPAGIDVDSNNDHLYWASYSESKIYSSNIDGSNVSLLLDDIQLPFDLELDITNGWMYVTSSYTFELGIYKCKLDGSNKQRIIQSGRHIENIALDFSGNRIYWTKPYLHSASFDGSDVKSRLEISASYMGIDITENYIYFSIWQNGNLYRIQKSNESATPELIYTTSPYFMSLKTYKVDGECLKYLVIENEEKRSGGYVLEEGFDMSFSDDNMETGWYRVISDNGDQMPMQPPSVNHCGTRKPIWLNGTLPDSEDGNVTRTACVQTNDDICGDTIEIEIRKCGDYYLYNLHNTSVNSSYCFGSGPVSCPSDMSSESGFYPGCTSNFPGEMIPVSVKPELMQGDALPIPGINPTPSLIPVFRSRFDDVSNGSYFYDVHWYINGNSIKSTTNVHYSNITTTDLKHTDWIGTYKMNMEVKCAIRSRFSKNGTPSPLMYSDVFHAGLYPDKYQYTVVEGESIDINLTSTVPVGCVASHATLRSRCKQNFYVFQPDYTNKDASCTNNIAKRDIVFKAHFCGISLGSVDWWEPRTLQVYGYSDALYNGNIRSTNIRISTSSISSFNDIWKDIVIPDIKVFVLDRDAILTNRLCQSYNDPHITTFDGRVYHYMNVGEFVMYRNDDGPYWVHALFTNCGYGWQGSSCHCGIAIRSRKSLLVLRTCSTISRTHKYMLSQPEVKLISCDESDLLIEQQGNNYKVTLPIGTEIRFSISTWSRFITMISIKPSVFDVTKAKGLCGYPSATKDSSDDFITREDGVIYDDQEFGNSWRITSSESTEQLFVIEPDFLNDDSSINDIADYNSTVRYCNCEKEASSVQSLDDADTLQCNATESTSFCTKLPHSTGKAGFDTSCTISKRRKRSADFEHSIFRRSVEVSDDVYESQPLQYDESVDSQVNLVPGTFRNGWTREKAYEECNRTLQERFGRVLNDFIDVENDGYVASCVIDIQLVGDTTFLQDTLSAIATKVMMEVVRNESYYNMTTEDGSQTLLEYFTNLLCPDNCSENGNCTSGICSCYEGFIGDDCSQQKSQPPSNVSLPFSGLCTLGTRACKRTNVYSNFLSNTVFYKLKYFKIQESGILYTSEEVIYLAVYRNLFMVTVDLPLHRGKRSASNGHMADGYEISFSYDRSNFGNPVVLIIYDENCYDCNQTTLACISLDTCTISTETPSTSDGKVKTAAIGASVGVLIVVVILIACLVYIKKKSAKKINTLPPPSEKTIDHSRASDKITLSSFDFEFDNRCGTPFELFMQNPPTGYFNKNSKPQFDIGNLNDRG